MVWSSAFCWGFSVGFGVLVLFFFFSLLFWSTKCSPSCSSILTYKLHTIYFIMKCMIWYTLLPPVVSFQAATAPCLVSLIAQPWCWHWHMHHLQRGSEGAAAAEAATIKHTHTDKTHPVIKQKTAISFFIALTSPCMSQLHKGLSMRFRKQGKKGSLHKGKKFLTISISKKENQKLSGI